MSRHIVNPNTKKNVLVQQIENTIDKYVVFTCMYY
jgi:hypothetical protein